VKNSEGEAMRKLNRRPVLAVQHCAFHYLQTVALVLQFAVCFFLPYVSSKPTDGQIFPILIGGDSDSSGATISRVDKDFQAKTIQGSEKFQNINGKPVKIHAVETDDHGRTYFAGDFHGHTDSNRNEIQKIWTGCPACNFEVQQFQFFHTSEHAVMQSLSFHAKADDCNSSYFSLVYQDQTVPSQRLYKNSTANDLLVAVNAVYNYKGLAVTHAWKSVSLMNATAQEYQYTWSFVLPQTRVCTDSRKLELIQVVEQPGGIGSACSVAPSNTNSSYKQPVGAINIFFETYNTNITVPWNATKQEWMTAANSGLGDNEIDITITQNDALDACGHSWNITFLKMQAHPLATVYSGVSNYALAMNGLEVVNGSAISGSFKLSFGQANASSPEWSELLPYNVSGDRLKAVLESSYDAIETVTVQRESLGDDQSFSWKVTFNGVHRNDTTGMVVGGNILPIIFNSSLIGGDGVYIASEEVVPGSFASGILALSMDRTWEPLGGGIGEEDDGVVYSVFIEKGKRNLAIGGDFKTIVDVVKENQTFVAGEYTCVTEQRKLFVKNVSVSTQNITNPLYNASMRGMNESRFVLVNRTSNYSRTNIENVTVCSHKHSIVGQHSFARRMKAGGLAVWNWERQRWKVLHQNHTLFGTVRALAIGDSSLVSLDQAGKSLYVGGQFTVEDRTLQKEVQTIITDLDRISEIHSIYTSSDVLCEIQYLYINVHKFRNTFRLTLDAAIDAEVYEVKTKFVSGGKFLLSISGHSACVDSHTSATNMESVVRSMHSDFAAVEVSRTGPVDNGYIWSITFNNVWSPQVLTANKYCSQGANSSNIVGLLGGSAQALVQNIAAKNVVSGYFGLQFMHEGVLYTSQGISVSDSAKTMQIKIAGIHPNVGNVRAVKIPHGYAGGYNIDISLYSVSDPSAMLTSTNVINGTVALQGNSVSMAIVKTKNSTTVNEIQILQFEWGLDKATPLSNFRLQYDGALSSVINVTTSAEVFKNVMESMSSIGVVNVDKFGDCINTLNSISECYWKIQFLTNGGNIDKLVLPYPYKILEDVTCSFSVTESRNGDEYLGGHFKLKYNGETSGNINYADSDESFSTALNSISALGTGNVVSSSDSDIDGQKLWNISFTGSSAGNIELLEIDSSPFLGPNVTFNNGRSSLIPVQNGSVITGSFSLAFGGNFSRNEWVTVPYNAGATEMREKLLLLTDMNNISVSRYGPLKIDESYRWDVTFLENIGLQPLLEKNSFLNGANAQVIVNRTQRGNGDGDNSLVLTLSNYSTKKLYHNMTSNELKMELEALPSVGSNLSVSRQGPSASGAYSWTVTFNSPENYGDVAPLQVSSALTILVEERVKGLAHHNLIMIDWGDAMKPETPLNLLKVEGAPSNGNILTMNTENNLLMVGGVLHYSQIVDGPLGRANTGSNLLGLSFYNPLSTRLQNYGGGLKQGTVGGTVRSVAVYGSRLVVGGTFDKANDVEHAKNIAEFKNGNWKTFSNGIEDTVYDVDIDHLGRVIVAGSFLASGCKTMKRLSVWEGGRIWMQIPSGIDNTINDIKVLPSPLAISVVPASGPTIGGVEVTVLSSFIAWKYGSPPNANAAVDELFSITIGSRECKEPKWARLSNTYGIKCILPGGYGSKNIVIIRSQGVESSVTNVSANFPYRIPEVHSVSHTLIPTVGGRVINVTGMNFGSFNPSVRIYIGDAMCISSIWVSNYVIQCKSPPGRGLNRSVIVFIDDQRNAYTAGHVTISYEAPVVNLISPSEVSTSGGTTVVLNGSGFSVTDPGNELIVSVFGKNVSSTWFSDNYVTFIAPDGVGANNTVITNCSQSVNEARILSYSKPKITGLNPSVGNTSGYLIVHVSGANFGVNHPLSYFYVQNTEPCATSNQTNSTKTDNYLNGTNSTGLSNSSNSSFYNTTNNNSNVTNTTDNGTLNRTNSSGGREIKHCPKMVPPPQNGTISKEALNVFVGNEPGLNVTWIDDYTLSFTLPPGTGRQEVSVQIAGQLSDPFSFAYKEPCVTKIVPSNGLKTTGGDVIHIYGFNLGFGENSSNPSWDISVQVGIFSRQCTHVYFISSQHLSCQTPPNVGANQSVTVNVSGLLSAVHAGAKVTYSAPVLSMVTPNVGPESGETTVCLHGSALSDGIQQSTVKIWFGPYPGNLSSIISFQESQICLNTTYGIGNQTVIIIAGNISSTWSQNILSENTKFRFQKCPYGEYTPGGTAYLSRKFDEKCGICTPGYYTDIFGAGVCIPCDTWSFQGRYGQSECNLCPKYSQSRFSASVAATNCSCIPGYYGNIGSECEKCPDGGSCPGGELSSLPLVAPGYSRSKLDNRIFVKCLPQHACVGGIVDKDGIPVDPNPLSGGDRALYNPRIGSLSNTGPNKHSVDKRINCSVSCLHQWEESWNEKASCTSRFVYHRDSTGTLLSTSLVRECKGGWAIGYREGNCSIDCANGFSDYPCNLTCSSDFRDGACDLVCESGYRENGVSSNNFTEHCADGYVGVACSECDDGHYRLTRNCEKCPEWSSWPNAEFFIFFAIIFGLSCFCLVIVGLASSPVPQPTLHIGFGFFQVIACLSRLRIQWLNEHLSLFTFFSGFSFNSQWMAFNCWSNTPLMTQPRLLIAFSLPLVFMFVMIALMYLHFVYHKFRNFYYTFTTKRAGKKRKGKYEREKDDKSESKEPEDRTVTLGEEKSKDSPGEDDAATSSRAKRQASIYKEESYGSEKEEFIEVDLKEIMWRYLNSYCKILCIMHTYIVAQALQVFSCYIRVDGVIIFKAEPHLECLTEEWQPWADLAGAALGIYGFGVPVFIILLIVPRLRGMFGWSLEDEGFRRKYGGIFLQYRQKYAWWEAFAMVYRGTLCTIISAPPTDSTVIGAGSAALLIIVIYLVLLSICQPYRDGNGATGGNLDLFCGAVLFCGMVCGGIGSLLVKLETGDKDHYDFKFPLPPSAGLELPEYSTAQVLMLLCFLFFLSGALGVLAALLNDIISACGRSQYNKIMKNSKGNAVMMSLFPRCHQGLTKEFPNFPVDVLEDFKADLMKLKSMYDVFHNVAEKSGEKHRAKKTVSALGVVTVEDLGPINLNEIGNIADEGVDVVGKQIELFQWVQRGRRREAKWCPAFIVEYDESNGRHNVRWTTPDGTVEKEWLRLAEETIKVPTMDTAAVVRASLSAADEEDIDIVDSRYSRSTMQMKKRGMQDQKKNEALIDRINQKMNQKPATSNSGFSPAAQKMLSKIDEPEKAGLKDALAEDDAKIFEKLKSRSKVQQLDGRQKDDDNEDEVMARLRKRTLGQSDFNKWGEDTDDAPTKTAESSDGDDDDPVLSKLKSKMKAPPVRNARRRMTKNENLESTSKLLAKRRQENGGTGIQGKMGNMTVNVSSSKAPPKRPSDDSDSSDSSGYGVKKITNKGSKKATAESSDSDDSDLGSSDDESDSDW
jgi:hypothetical protein